MNAIARLALVILITLLASLAVAADPEPQAPANPPTNGEQQAVPNLDINQAELEAGVALDPVDPVELPGGELPASPMMLEIKSTLDANRTAVAELAARAAATPAHDANLAIQREIAVLKQQAELDVLAIQVRYARADGNEELADQIEAAIAAIISPPAPTAPTEARPTPAGLH